MILSDCQVMFLPQNVDYKMVPSTHIIRNISFANGAGKFKSPSNVVVLVNAKFGNRFCKWMPFLWGNDSWLIKRVSIIISETLHVSFQLALMIQRAKIILQYRSLWWERITWSFYLKAHFQLWMRWETIMPTESHTENWLAVKQNHQLGKLFPAL